VEPSIATTQTLHIHATVQLQVTPEQFAAIAAHNRDLRLERTARGKLLVNPPTGGETGRRNLKIAALLYIWWHNADEPGEVFDSSTGFSLPSGAILSPDASWVSADRWASLTQAQREGFPPICPDFVVELRSKSDSLRMLRSKMQEYRDNGAQLGWLLDPQSRSIEIYRAAGGTETLDDPVEASGESVLPGFVLKLAQVWN